MLKGLLEKSFKLEKHQTNIKTEVLAGLTTFLAMAYIIFVNPAILSQAGMDKGALFTSTCLLTAGATMLSAFTSNSPIAIAPGMALNTVFAFVIVKDYGYSWENALGMVFISGIIFLFLTITKIRTILIHSIPECMATAIITGISLLIALIALKTNDIIIINTNAFLQLGQLANLKCGLFFAGFIFIVYLDYKKIPGAVLIGILTITIINIIINHTGLTGFMSSPPSMEPTLFKLKFDQLNTSHAKHQILSFVLIALFDATGTLVGLLHTPTFIKLKNTERKIEGSLLADSFATTCASVMGSSSTSPYIESATGIETGGRTGLTALVVSLLFILSLFFAPIVGLIPSYAVGSALLYIACCIMKGVAQLDTADITDFAPAVLTLLMIPFSFSIADGIGVGVISYTILKLATRQFKSLNPMLVILTAVFLSYFLNLI